MPELKKFLVTNKEADQYEKLTVKFIPGRKAILTILDDGKETEKIVLSDYNDREKMHALLAEKGFKKKSSEELGKLEEEVAAAAAKKGAPAIPKDRKTSVTIKRVAKTGAAARTATASEVGAVQREATEAEEKDGDGEGDDDSGGDDDQDNDDDSGSDSEGDDDAEGDDAEGDDDEADDDDDDLKDLEPKKKEERREIGGEDGGEGTKSKTPPKPVPPQLRKAKSQSSGTKNSKEASPSQQFVLVVSTLCIVCFALSRKFPFLRVFFGRLLGCGRHQHAR